MIKIKTLHFFVSVEDQIINFPPLYTRYQRDNINDAKLAYFFPMKTNRLSFIFYYIVLGISKKKPKSVFAPPLIL